MGPDAEAFVNFMFYNTMKTLKVGHIRYGFLLTEGGIVYDDGVVARLAPDRFLISCSSSHVDGVRGPCLETWRQDGNDPDRIFIHDLTMQWATVTVTGPKAREILTTLNLEHRPLARSAPLHDLRRNHLERRAHAHRPRLLLGRPQLRDVRPPIPGPRPLGRCA